MAAGGTESDTLAYDLQRYVMIQTFLSTYYYVKIVWSYLIFIRFLALKIVVCHIQLYIHLRDTILVEFFDSPIFLFKRTDFEISGIRFPETFLNLIDNSRNDVLH